MRMTRNDHDPSDRGDLHVYSQSAMMVTMIEQAIQRSLALDARAAEITKIMNTVLREAIHDPMLCRECSSIATTLFRYAVQAVAVEEPELVGQYILWTRKSLHQTEALADLLPTIIDALDASTAVLDDESLIQAMAAPLASARLAMQSEAPLPDAPNTLDAGTTAGQCALRFLGAILEGDRQLALDLIRRGVEGDLSVHDVMHEVILPTQRMVGNLWHAGEITIADEHFATATADMALTSLRPYYPPVSPRNERVVLGTVSGDMHAIGSRVASDCFEMDGWQAVYLGPNMPATDLLQATVDYEARVLALSTTAPLFLREVAVLIAEARKNPATQSLQILVGGPTFDQFDGLWVRLGADAYARTPAEAPEKAAELLGNG